jgi:hypothetical protein
MASRLSVIFFIILCLEVGIVLTFLPWVHPFKLNDWADNYLLLYASRKTGLMGLQHVMSSGWVRGAVSGLGVLNLFMAFWEVAHFDRTVNYLQAEAARANAKKDAAQAVNTDRLSDYEGRDDATQRSGQ